MANITSAQVKEAIDQLAAMTAAASITPEAVASVMEKLRNLTDAERQQIIEVASAYLTEIDTKSQEWLNRLLSTGGPADKIVTKNGSNVQSELDTLISKVEDLAGGEITESLDVACTATGGVNKTSFASAYELPQNLSGEITFTLENYEMISDISKLSLHLYNSDGVKFEMISFNTTQIPIEAENLARVGCYISKDYVTKNGTFSIKVNSIIKGLKDSFRELVDDYKEAKEKISSNTDDIAKCKEGIVYGEEEDVHRITAADLTIDGGVVVSTGTFKLQASWYRTDYLEVTPNAELTICSTHGQTMGTCFYDVNKTFIEGSGLIDYNNDKEYKYTIPSNAKYVIWSVADKSENNYISYKNGVKDVMVNEAVKRIEGRTDALEEEVEDIKEGKTASYWMYGSSSVQRMESATGEFSLKNQIGDIVSSGNGGENIQQTSCRIGNDAIVICKNFTIPADTTEVVIGSKTNSLKSRGVNIQFVEVNGEALPKLNPVEINGVEGRLYANGSNYYFARSEAGTAQKVSIGDFAVPTKIKNNSRIHISMLGYNYGNETNEEYLDFHKRMRMLAKGRMLAITIMVDRSNGGSWANTTENALLKESMIENEFGVYCFNIRKYLLNHAIDDGKALGILNSTYPTAQDIEDVTNGVVPTSLRADAAHLTPKGYEIIIWKIGQLCKMLFE